VVGEYVHERTVFMGASQPVATRDHRDHDEPADPQLVETAENLDGRPRLPPIVEIVSPRSAAIFGKHHPLIVTYDQLS